VWRSRPDSCRPATAAAPPDRHFAVPRCATIGQLVKLNWKDYIDSPNIQFSVLVPLNNPVRTSTMSIINTQVQPFKAQAFHNGKFIEVTDQSLKGKWSR